MRKFLLLLSSILLPLHAHAATDRKLDAGNLQFKEMVSAPATPSAGYVNTYGKTDGFRYFMNSSGTEFRILDASSFGTNGQLWRTTGSAIGLTTSTFPSTNSAGDLLYGSGANAYGNLSVGTANQLLGANNGGTAPEYKAATVTSAGAGTFPGALRSNDSLVLEDPGAGTDTITLQAVTPSAGSFTLRLPPADGTNGQAIKTDGAGNLTFGDAGAGGAGINLITLDTAANNWAISKGTNFDLEASIGDWAAYADAAGTTPVDMTGGSPGTTCARDTTDEINGLASLKMDLGSGSSRQGEGCSILVNVPTAYRGKNVAFIFPFTTSGTLIQDDLKLAAYDVTNGALISVYERGKVLGASGQAIGIISIPGTAAQIRVGVHVARTSTAALSMIGDDFQVSPQIPAQGLKGGQYVGKAYYANTANCAWSGTSSSTVDYGTDADCPAPTVDQETTKFGSISTVDADLPQVTINNTIRGRYEVCALFMPVPDSSVLANYYLTDGTTRSPEWQIRRDDASTSGINPGNICYSWKYESGASTKTFKFQYDIASGTSRIGNGGTSANTPTTFTIKWFPLSGDEDTTVSDSSTFWISSFLASGSHTTSTPTSLGQYRCYRKSSGNSNTFTAEAPSVTPSAANGMRIYAIDYVSNGTSGQCSVYEIFIGRDKNWKVEAWDTTGRSGNVATDYSISGTTAYGLRISYNPVNGVLYVDGGLNDDSSINLRQLGRKMVGGSGSNIADGYFDVKVSENALAVTADGAPRSESYVYGVQGGGATATAMVYFAATSTTTGSGITYTASSTNGDKWTINENGVYTMSAMLPFSAGGGEFVIMKNPSDTTTAAASDTNYSQHLAYSTRNAAANEYVSASTGGVYLPVGTVIQVKYEKSISLTTGATPRTGWFRITKVSN